MNERIEDLMYHAGLTASGCWDKMDEYDQKAIEKMAVLILKECIDNVKVWEMDSRNHISYMLEQHFGVEE